MNNESEEHQRKLHGYAVQGLTLEKALEDCIDILTSEGRDALALLYATNRCFLARLKNGNLLDQDDSLVSTAAVYEARMFSDNTELRWLNRDGGSGDAALLTETQPALNDSWKNRADLNQDVVSAGTIKHSYLLWGESVLPPRNGWIKMATPRIGGYYSPFAMDVSHEYEPTKLRLQLNAIEYLSQEPEHGNVFVAEERWLNISIARAESHGEREG